MVRDPIPFLQANLSAYLRSRPESGGDRIELDASIGKSVPWRPHLLQNRSNRAWYLHAVPPISDSWSKRIRIAQSAKKKLQIGVAGSEDLLSEEEFLETCHEMNASILSYKTRGDSVFGHRYFSSTEDFICECRLKLSSDCAAKILDISYARALAEKNSQKKGVLLESVVAVLLSQVDGFEVTDIGISNRTQQMDVFVHNRNVGGTLGASPIVLAEAKNWKNPVGTDEYAIFLRKLETRHARAKLGYLVTTGRFTSGVEAERRRDSKNDVLVVLIDGKSLPLLWGDTHQNISERFERITSLAAIGN